MQVRNINFWANKAAKATTVPMVQPLSTCSLVFSVMIKTPTTPICLNVTFNVSESVFFALAFSPLSLLDLLSVHCTLFVVSVSLEFSSGFLANGISWLSFLFQYVDLHFSFSALHFSLFLIFHFSFPLCFCFFPYLSKSVLWVFM